MFIIFEEIFHSIPYSGLYDVLFKTFPDSEQTLLGFVLINGLWVFFHSVLLFCSVLLLADLDLSTLYYYFALYYYLGLQRET